MTIQFTVIDRSRPSWKTSSDVYRPILTAFEHVSASDCQSIHHIDVVHTWKGISLYQAEELLFWEEGLTQAIETILEEYVIAKFEKAGIHLDSIDSGESDPVH
jgi:hypothetical protein